MIATTAKEKFPAYIGFKTPISPLNAQQGAQENTKQVSIIGTTDGAAQELKAYAIQKTEVTEEGEDVEEKEVTLGLLNVISYDLIRNKVIIVPVNGVAAPSAALLSMELNAIYGQAVAEWEVVIDAPFSTDEDLVASLDEGESNMLSSFTANMKKFNRKFKRSRDLDKDAYYVFLVDGVQTSLSGFMPFKRQYGYIFNNDDVKTIAHELGHGAFCLRHTFSSEAFIANQGSTDNLMDYLPAGAGSSGSNTKLYKHQWDNIHNPEKMIGWFEGDEESAYDLTRELYQKILQEIRCAYLDNSTSYQSDYLKRIPDSRPTFDVGTLQLGAVEIEDVDMYFKGKYPNYNDTELPAVISATYHNPTWGADYYEYKLGNLYILTDEESSDLASYLQPNESQVKADLNTVMDNIDLSGNDISGKSFDQLFAIASCATQYLSAEQRIQLIKLIIKEEPILDEDYEDLILDILMTTPDGDAKAVYETVMAKSGELLSDLIDGIDNIGDGEQNYNRLGNEIYRLFQKSNIQTKAYADNLIVPVDPSYGSICPYKAKVNRSGFTFTVGGQKSSKIERVASEIPGNIRPDGYGSVNTAAYNTDCGYEQDEATKPIRFDEVVSVVFEEDMLNGQTPRRYQMPAFVYYQIIDARRNQEIYKSLDAAWMVLGLVTPIDELYILTKVLSLGTRAAYTVNLAKLKLLMKERKTVLSAEHYDEITVASRGVVGDIGQYVVKATQSGDLIAGLSGTLKSTYDDLIAAGLTSEIKANSILIKDKGETVAIISNDKFTPTKWTLQRKSKGALISQTDEGYKLIKTDGEYAFELGYKENRALSAEEVNLFHKSVGNHEPYKPLTTAIERSLQSGDKVYIVEYANEGIPSPGGWGSKNQITSLKEVREDLAILNDWKDANKDALVLREYTLKKPLPVRDGVVRPLQETSGQNTGTVYRGNQQQYEFIEYLGGERWKDYLNDPVEYLLK